MKNLLSKKLGLILPLALALTGCSSNSPNPEPSSAAVPEEMVVSESHDTGLPFDFEVEPEEFTLSFEVEQTLITAAAKGERRTVLDYGKVGDTVSWRYPDEQISVSLTPEKDYLSVEITSENENDNSFTWPVISADTYYFPFGEGKRIPADDPAWFDYLNGQEFQVMEQLSMPFWISSAGSYNLLFVMEDPYRTEMNFTSDSPIAFSVSHQYPAIDDNRTNKFRIYITDKDPVSAAKLYRNYVIEQGQFTTLEQKAEANPNIRKLYGAPFIYLWGDLVVSADNINWQAFRTSLSSPVMEYFLSFAGRLENGQEFTSVLKEIQGQDYVAEYQKNVICSYISQLLKRDDFWEPSVFTQRSSELEVLLAKGYGNLSETDRIQVHKYAVSSNLPEVFADAGQWMDSQTVALLQEMKEGGIEHAWIGLNSWEQAYGKPELVETAVSQDYLIASYDSYHSIHEPGKEQWITAQFDDPSLYENAVITDQNGKPESGFQNVGRKLNPTLSLPAVKNRMEGIMSNQLPFNSWFIDCDATGEIYDDYTPSHITTQEEDLAARLERMSYIRDQYHLVIGSEGGNDFAASDIAYAHGIELKTFAWMDEDMKKNQDSDYYIGKYYNPNGGVAEHFSKRIPVKEQYHTTFVDPKYDIPLFKLVYNDSVITSYHWDWSTFKIKGATADRMIREILYNVPPLYHLDAVEWSKYKEDILRHQTVWSDFSQTAVTREMTGFEYKSEDGSVQKTVFGDGGDAAAAAVANFGDSPYQYENIEIPAHSVLIEMNGSREVYTPSLDPEHV